MSEPYHLVPVRCMTCGKVIAHFQEIYNELLAGVGPEQAYQVLGQRYFNQLQKYLPGVKTKELDYGLWKLQSFQINESIDDGQKIWKIPVSSILRILDKLKLSDQQIKDIADGIPKENFLGLMGQDFAINRKFSEKIGTIKPFYREDAPEKIGTIKPSSREDAPEKIGTIKPSSREDPTYFSGFEDAPGEVIDIKLFQKGLHPGRALDVLGVTNECCRISILNPPLVGEPPLSVWESEHEVDGYIIDPLFFPSDRVGQEKELLSWIREGKELPTKTRINLRGVDAEIYRLIMQRPSQLEPNLVPVRYLRRLFAEEIESDTLPIEKFGRQLADTLLALRTSASLKEVLQEDVVSSELFLDHILFMIPDALFGEFRDDIEAGTADYLPEATLEYLKRFSAEKPRELKSLVKIKHVTKDVSSMSIVETPGVSNVLGSIRNEPKSRNRPNPKQRGLISPGVRQFFAN